VTKSNTSKIKSKLSDRGIPCIFLGYAKDHAPNVYRMLKLDTNAIIITRDIIWLKKLYWKYMGIMKVKKYQIEEDDNSNASIVELIDNFHEEKKSVERSVVENIEEEKTVEIKNNQFASMNDREERIPRWQRNLQTFYNPSGREDEDDVVSLEYGEIAYLSMLEGSVDEPKIFNQAWNHIDDNDRKFWRQAITKELKDMNKQEVWEIINKKLVPKERSLIGNKWVFKQKKNGIYRARLVALGYSQIPGVDFSENYAPVVNDITMRMMLVLKMENNWMSETIDVETAFLYGDLTEKIYMTIPRGLEEYAN
jgi:Reverse transcriptase (RNA-dependent DNA polymerase)